MAAILGTLTACCGQWEGTGLENSCALDIWPSPKIHTPRPAVGLDTASGNSKPRGHDGYANDLGRFGGNIQNL